MCGILAFVKKKPFEGKTASALEKAFALLKPRGPDEQGAFHNEDIFMAHSRLSIINPEAGPQPILQGNWVICVNGEIYNKNPNLHHAETDCHLIPKYLDKYGLDAMKHLDGVFAFVAYNRETQQVVVARDMIGVVPLYYCDFNGGTQFSSLLASCIVTESSGDAQIVRPGYYASFNVGESPTFKRWARPYNPWSDLTLKNAPGDMVSLMIDSVSKRLMGDVPWGVLLSGGLDSTIVATIAASVAKELRPDFPRVHTFCIGLRDSPDIEWAKKVAKELDTYHVSVEYTVEEGIAAVREVVRAVETYDVTTIRASVPMWLLGRVLKRRGIKMVLSGEGSDELFAGYLYNLYCPSETDMVVECTRKMVQLHGYDCQRANKAMGDNGVEARVPFLDKNIVDLAMNRLHPRFKMSGTHPDGPKPEKWWLRKTFANIVPAGVAERTKAQFSDAVGSEWIDALKAHAEGIVSDKIFARADEIYPHNTPMTKEAFWYRHIFADTFKARSGETTALYTGDSIACSTGPASKWHSAFKRHLDPSGDAIQRAVEEE